MDDKADIDERLEELERREREVEKRERALKAHGIRYNIYQHVHVSPRSLDIFIGVCIFLVLALLVIGVLTREPRL
ncbi:MAG: hypothetical protein LBR29_05880 [Methylobacteriaceae bacterium]|jgi:hypothetical protein|nr:hypothetical protein [Methylobacteriaceae bacterium]